MQNVIFDFGRVIVHFDEEYMTSRYVKNPKDCEQVKGVVFDRLYWDRFDDGSLTTESAKEMMKERLPENLHSDACAVLDNWYRDLKLIDGMKELILDLKKSGKRLYLLSNVGIDFSRNYNSVPMLCELFSHFDGLVFSGELHIVKPSREIFNHLLTKYGIKAEESIFVDDAPRNIEGARAVGIKGILFDGDADRLRAQIL